MTVTVNGLQFHVGETGVGPVVLLLHGFPDTGEVWRRQVPALVAAGFRAVVPDLRGRGRSERRGRVEAYALPELVADATGILDALGSSVRMSSATTGEPRSPGASQRSRARGGTNPPLLARRTAPVAPAIADSAKWTVRFQRPIVSADALRPPVAPEGSNLSTLSA